MSSPNSLIATSPRTPLIISFIRISIGWVITTFCPGRSRNRWLMRSVNSAWLEARVHWSCDRNDTNTSVSSIPMGSVATSAVPERLQTWRISSGNSCSSKRSMRPFITVEVSRLVPGRRTMLATMPPSDRRGMNSAPRPRNSSTATSTLARLAPTTAKRWRRARRRQGA